MTSVFKRSLLLKLGLAMAGITMLAFAGMLSSVFIAETSEGQAAAINQAGSLRMQSYRIASALAQGRAPDRTQLERTRELILEFDSRLRSPRLTGVLARSSDARLQDAYEKIVTRWREQVRPTLDTYLASIDPGAAPGIILDATPFGQRYLDNVDSFVNDIDELVSVLELAAEEKIALLRLIQIVSLFLTIFVVVVTMYMMNTDVLNPLRDLLNAARAVRHGDFSRQIRCRNDDELGQLAYAFNLMSEDLSKTYAELEARVREKTGDLERSNRSLELLYRTTRQLGETPVNDTVYETLIRDIEQLAGTGPGTICLGEDDGGQTFKFATTRQPAPDQPDICNPPNCKACFEGNETHFVKVARQQCEPLVVFSTPIKDHHQQYGVLLVEMKNAAPLKDWKRRLLETVASHIAIALNMNRRASQARMLALLEERSVIARELHDSLAQSLSYLKIQVSRLDSVIHQSFDAARMSRITAELRDGLNSAYRQLRELLTTFRLRVDEAGLDGALEQTVQEFRQRGDLEIELDNRLGGCALSPNAEIHIIQLVREAMSNVVRHAKAHRCVVSAVCEIDGCVQVAVDDDGIGLPQVTGRPHHYGLAIMKERAHGLGGTLSIIPSHLGGTRVEVTFNAAGRRAPLTGNQRQEKRINEQ